MSGLSCELGLPNVRHPQIPAPDPSLCMPGQQKGQRVAFCHHHTCLPSATRMGIRPTGTARSFLPGLGAFQGKTCPFPWEWPCQHPSGPITSEGRRTTEPILGKDTPGEGEKPSQQPAQSRGIPQAASSPESHWIIPSRSCLRGELARFTRAPWNSPLALQQLSLGTTGSQGAARTCI